MGNVCLEVTEVTAELRIAASGSVGRIRRTLQTLVDGKYQELGLRRDFKHCTISLESQPITAVRRRAIKIAR